MATILDISDFVYRTGTLTIAPGDTTALFTGANIATTVKDGDHLEAGGVSVPIKSVTDGTHAELFYPWPGPEITDGDYLILKASLLRYHTALIGYDSASFIAMLDGLSVFYAVAGEAPDVSFGEDGNYALKTNNGPWKFWLKTGGVWELQGSPVGFVVRGAWQAGETYGVNDLATFGGVLYGSLQAGNTGHNPTSSPTYWQALVTGGDRYDLASFDTDRPASGELLVKIYPLGVTFPMGLSNSQAGAESEATADAVFSFTKNDIEFATLTFPADSTSGVFDCAEDAIFESGDVLRILAPSPRDETLSGVAVSLIGFR